MVNWWACDKRVVISDFGAVFGPVLFFFTFVFGFDDSSTSVLVVLWCNVSNFCMLVRPSKPQRSGMTVLVYTTLATLSCANSIVASFVIVCFMYSIILECMGASAWLCSMLKTILPLAVTSMEKLLSIQTSVPWPWHPKFISSSGVSGVEDDKHTWKIALSMRSKVVAAVEVESWIFFLCACQTCRGPHVMDAKLNWDTCLASSACARRRILSNSRTHSLVDKMLPSFRSASNVYHLEFTTTATCLARG